MLLFFHLNDLLSGLYQSRKEASPSVSPLLLILPTYILMNCESTMKRIGKIEDRQFYTPLHLDLYYRPLSYGCSVKFVPYA